MYPNLCSFENLYLAFRKAAKGKGKKDAVVDFSFYAEQNLLQLGKALYEKSWAPGGYNTFKIYDPKERIISAAPFEDRVVHHALCNIIAERKAGPNAGLNVGSLGWSNFTPPNSGTHPANRISTVLRHPEPEIVVTFIRVVPVAVRGPVVPGIVVVPGPTTDHPGGLRLAHYPKFKANFSNYLTAGHLSCHKNLSAEQMGTKFYPAIEMGRTKFFVGFCAFVLSWQKTSNSPCKKKKIFRRFAPKEKKG